MIREKVEFMAPSISHFIIVATVVVPFRKKRVEIKKLNFVSLKCLKELKLLRSDNNSPSLGPLPRKRDAKS